MELVSIFLRRLFSIWDPGEATKIVEQNIKIFQLKQNKHGLTENMQKFKSLRQRWLEFQINILYLQITDQKESKLTLSGMSS